MLPTAEASFANRWQPARRCVLLGLGCSLLAGPAAAGPILLVQAATLLLQLEDGRVGKLAGITLPAPAGLDLGVTRTAAATWLAAGPVALQELGPGDRHGRLPVVAEREGESLQASLLRRGLAVAAPGPGLSGGFVADLLAAERPARAGRLGFWRDGLVGPLPAAEVRGDATRYALVEGRLDRAAMTARFWYGNFGRSLRDDMTVRAPRALAEGWARQGLDLAGLGGRPICVRGWLFEDNGPMIEITHPLALEVLG